MLTVVRSLRALVSALILSSVVMATGKPVQAEASFVPGPTQYIAALGDPMATSGTGAETWGFWELDPGPRGVWSRQYADLIANGGLAPAGWQFDGAAWWLEEHGLIMEAPSFPVPPGHYVVTGGREVTQVLTIDSADAAGKQTWSLAERATLYDVTHLGCRAAVYTAMEGQSCTPDHTPTGAFPMRPGLAVDLPDGRALQNLV